MVEGIELSGSIDAGSFHDLHGEGCVQILLHEEEHCRGRNAGDNKRDETVLQAHPGDQLQEAQRRHLCGHRHDEQDDGKRSLFEPEVIGVNAIGRESREVDTEGCRAGRDDQAVPYAGQHRNVGIRQHILQVRHQGFAGQEGESLLDLKMGAGGVDEQHIEEEQAQKAQQHQNHIAYRTAGSKCCLFRFCFCCMRHYAFPPFACLAACLRALRSALLRPSSSRVRER